jgi:peptidyl-prolyl cis-trans isomerase D
MLESMHRHMKWIMWIIVGLITIAFLFFGIYPSDDSGRMVAKVDGDIITVDDFNRVYKNMYDNYREVLKDQFNESFAKTLKSQALGELIRNRLLVREAERAGLRVSDEELQSAIMKIPAFSRQGRFDRGTYEGYLRYINVSPAVFEANQREFMMRTKLERLVEESVDVTDGELAAIYKERNAKAKPGDFEKSRTNLRQQALMEKRNAALDAYVRGLQAKASVKVNQEAVGL